MSVIFAALLVGSLGAYPLYLGLTTANRARTGISLAIMLGSGCFVALGETVDAAIPVLTYFTALVLAIWAWVTVAALIARLQVTQMSQG